MSTPICPLLKKECIEHKCAFFTHIVGMHPQTGKELDQWDCSIRWLPILITEGARQTHNACAGIESMRNEIVKRMDNHEADRITSTERLYGPVRQARIVDDTSTD